MNFVVQI